MGRRTEVSKASFVQRDGYAALLACDKGNLIKTFQFLERSADIAERIADIQLANFLAVGVKHLIGHHNTGNITKAEYSKENILGLAPLGLLQNSGCVINRLDTGRHGSKHGRAAFGSSC